MSHLVEPASLIAPRESDERPPFRQLVKPRDFERQPQRIPAGQHIADRADLDPLGVVNHMLGEDRQAAHLDAFAVKMMLREADGIEAHALGELRDFDHFVDHLLPALRTVGDWA